MQFKSVTQKLHDFKNYEAFKFEQYNVLLKDNSEAINSTSIILKSRSINYQNEKKYIIMIYDT